MVMDLHVPSCLLPHRCHLRTGLRMVAFAPESSAVNGSARHFNNPDVRPGPQICSPDIVQRAFCRRPLFVLGRFVGETFPRWHEFAQFSSHHLLRDVDLLVRLSVVHRESKADKIGQDRGCASLCLDHGRRLSGPGRPEVGKRDDVRSCVESTM